MPNNALIKIIRIILRVWKLTSSTLTSSKHQVYFILLLILLLKILVKSLNIDTENFHQSKLNKQNEKSIQTHCQLNRSYATNYSLLPSIDPLLLLFKFIYQYSFRFRRLFGLSFETSKSRFGQKRILCLLLAKTFYAPYCQKEALLYLVLLSTLRRASLTLSTDLYPFIYISKYK